MKWLSVRVDDWPGWLGAQFAGGAERLNVDPLGDPQPAASGNVIGGRVRIDGEVAWLRVAPFREYAQDREAWTGTADAAGIKGVRKPTLLGSAEWTAEDPVATPVRAELMTYIAEPVIAEQYLDCQVDLPDAWFTDLRASLDTLAAHDTDRVLWWHSPERVSYGMHAAYGPLPTGIEPSWRTEHLDLHWGQLTAPNLSILDWEHWGRGVAGFGPARLYCAALAAPDTAKRVYEVFADVLEAPSGRYAQLLAAADTLGTLATYEDEVGLAPRLRALVADLLSRC